jgi:hypothetical protein
MALVHGGHDHRHWVDEVPVQIDEEQGQSFGTGAQRSAHGIAWRKLNLEVGRELNYTGPDRVSRAPISKIASPGTRSGDRAETVQAPKEAGSFLRIIAEAAKPASREIPQKQSSRVYSLAARRDAPATQDWRRFTPLLLFSLEAVSESRILHGQERKCWGNKRHTY